MKLLRIVAVAALTAFGGITGGASVVHANARGIAQMMRVNLFRPVHVKMLVSQKRRALLTARKLLQEKAIAIENDIRGLLRNFGLKVGVVGLIKFEERISNLSKACRILPRS